MNLGVEANPSLGWYEFIIVYRYSPAKKLRLAGDLWLATTGQVWNPGGNADEETINFCVDPEIEITVLILDATKTCADFTVSFTLKPDFRLLKAVSSPKMG